DLIPKMSGPAHMGCKICVSGLLKSAERVKSSVCLRKAHGSKLKYLLQEERVRTMINVLFADDHEMVRIGVSAYLSAQPDINVAAEADDGGEAVRLALELRPDIILMDIVMDEMDGIEATKQIIAEWPEAKIIVVTSFLDDEKVYPALEAGAVSY